MTNLRWWLSVSNPRLIYMVAGASIMGGTELSLLALVAEGPPFIILTVAMVAWFALICGVGLISWQRHREEEHCFIAHAMEEYRHEMELVAEQAMLATAERFNDHCEAAGHGRPIVLERIVYH